MRARVTIWAAISGALLLTMSSGCVSRAPYDQITRWSASPAVRPQDAAFPAYHLRRQGDLAAGTLALGGGEVILDGLYYYQCGADGVVYQLPPGEPLASGWSVRFRPDRVEVLEADFSLAKLAALLTVSVPDKDMPCAFRIAGRFASVRLASGPSLQRVSGTVFGFRQPQNDPARGGTGLTLHFLSGDLLTGGRVADFGLIDGSLALDLCPRYLLINSALTPAVNALRR